MTEADWLVCRLLVQSCGADCLSVRLSRPFDGRGRALRSGKCNDMESLAAQR